MNNLLSEIKYLAKKSGLHPQRKSGQNFLINKEILEKIIYSANLSKSDHVLEIGAGFGALTRELAEKVQKVWAVELEKRFIPSLIKLSILYPAIKVIKKDILKVNIHQLVGKNSYKVVANVPYNITSLILRRFLEQEPKPSSLILLLQKEVAERITAKPGNLSLLALSVQFYGEPQIIQLVNKNNFWPAPAVDSAIVRIEKIKSSNDINKEFKEKNNITEKEFFQVVRTGFSAKRRQIQNNLANSFHVAKEQIKTYLKKIGLDPTIRPQGLSLEDWKMLTSILKRKRIIGKMPKNTNFL